MLNLIFEKLSQFSDNSQKISDYLFDKGKNDIDTVFSVKLAIYELVGNVIKYSKSQAKVNLACDGDIIRILIRGSKEFELKTIELPPIECECGRGIYIIKQMSESLEYYNGGKDVCVCIKCKNNRN